MTKKYSRLSLVFTILSWALSVLPFSIYVISALASDALVSEKMTLVSTVLIVGIMSLVAIVNKTVLRSRLWILLIGLYICLDSIMTALIVIGACQILDELIVAPLKKRFRTLKMIHKEMDKRSHG